MLTHETTCQIAVCDWLYQFREQTKKIFYFHVPNGGSRHVREATKLKRMGVVAGVLDLWIFTAKEILIIEFKSQDGVLSESQRKCMSALDFLGYKHHTISTNDPAVALKKVQDLVLAAV